MIYIIIMFLFVAILLTAINNSIILLILIVIMFNPYTDRSRVTLAHHELLLHDRNELVGDAKNLVGFLSYILCLNSSLDKEYGLETRRDSSRDRRSRKISHNPTKFGICSVQRSLYLLYPLRRPCLIHNAALLMRF